MHTLPLVYPVPLSCREVPPVGLMWRWEAEYRGCCIHVCVHLEMGAQVWGPRHDLGSHANLINSSTSRQPGLISSNLKRGLCDPPSLHEPEIQREHTNTHMLKDTLISKYSHTNTQKIYTSQGHCQGCKDFPSDVFPMAWRETLPARQPPPLPIPPPFLPSSLSTTSKAPWHPASS